MRDRASTSGSRFEQPIGPPVPGWRPPPAPSRQSMEGRFCRLEPLDPERHAEALYAAHSRDATGRTWTYLPYGPFDSLDAYRSWMDSFCRQDDPLFFVILTESERAPVGVASYLRIAPGNGAIEVGHIHYTELLRKRPAATEAMYLMMSNAFDLGYRRYEWKCDALNAASRTAARRLGFSFEGIFRQATVYKGRNRDTAWFAVIDSEWDALNGAYQKWLDPGNFDGDGRQRTRLSDLTRTLPRREA